jgi:hypothetical protein
MVSYFTLGRESGVAPRRHAQPKPLSWEWISLMWRRADMCSGIRIAGNRATTRASVGPKILSGLKVTPAMSAGVTDRLRENLVEMLGAFEAS